MALYYIRDEGNRPYRIADCMPYEIDGARIDYQLRDTITKHLEEKVFYWEQSRLAQRIAAAVDPVARQNLEWRKTGESLTHEVKLKREQLYRLNEDRYNRSIEGSEIESNIAFLEKKLKATKVKLQSVRYITMFEGDHDFEDDVERAKITEFVFDELSKLLRAKPHQEKA